MRLGKLQIGVRRERELPGLPGAAGAQIPSSGLKSLLRLCSGSCWPLCCCSPGSGLLEAVRTEGCVPRVSSEEGVFGCLCHGDVAIQAFLGCSREVCGRCKAGGGGTRSDRGPQRDLARSRSSAACTWHCRRVPGEADGLESCRFPFPHPSGQRRAQCPSFLILGISPAWLHPNVAQFREG